MSEIGEQVRWGILGTASIAGSAFLPALRETGDGVPVAVGSRDLERGRAWATEQLVARAVEGYDAVIADPDVEAVYIPLPNGLHADWTIAALEAGKTVLCEKPLCGTVEETERVLAAARSAAGSLWEAFVFPFHEQMDRVRELLAGGTIGEVREIQSRFHFVLDDPGDIRLFSDLAGG
jgi:predicted dehydrogenase